MKRLFGSLFFLYGCASLPPIIPTPEQAIIYDTTHIKVNVWDTSYKTVIIEDTNLQITVIPDTVFAINGEVSVKDFGAKCDGVTDDIVADSTACMYCIQNPQICTTVKFPVGSSLISRPLKLQNNGRYFTIRLVGDVSNKSASGSYLSQIICNFKSSYGIGIQYGRSIEIENISLLGAYTFPNHINNYNIGTTTFAQWDDGSVSDSRYTPYAGISIDPDTNISGSRGGTSDVTVKNCSIKQFMVGIALSPNGVTQNAEMINILEDDIESCRVSIAICQDQSKTINIKGLKVWSSVHTVLDGVHYGQGLGGGSVFCENWNIAGYVNELFNITTSRFPLSCKDIYSESLFRIGTVGPMANFGNTEIDFLVGSGMPEADYIISGTPNFNGGMIRYYDGDPFHRLNFNNLKVKFSDMTLNNPPITSALYGNLKYPIPQFENVNLWLTGQTLTTPYDTLIPIRWVPNFNVDRINWVASFAGDTTYHIGDYVIASPTSTNGKFWDSALKSRPVCNHSNWPRNFCFKWNSLSK